MSKENKASLLVKLYEWAHSKFPKYVDCRPIYVEQSVKDAGFKICLSETHKLSGLPVKIVLAQ